MSLRPGLHVRLIENSYSPALNKCACVYPCIYVHSSRGMNWTSCLSQTAGGATNTLQDNGCLPSDLYFPLPSRLSASFSGGAGGVVDKWTGSDAVHQHRRGLLFPATVHRLHPRDTHLPPQGRRQAPGLLQGGQGGYHSTAATWK